MKIRRAINTVRLLIIKAIRGIFVIVLLLLLMFLCRQFLHMFFSPPPKYAIRIYSDKNDHWEGWKLICGLDRILDRYPEVLPCVNEAESRIKEVVEAYRKACSKNPYETVPNSGNTLYWDFGEGLYHFDDICSKERIRDYFREGRAHDDPYLTADGEHYMQRPLGRLVKDGAYYFNAWNEGDDDQRHYYFYGLFIELSPRGWRLAVHDLEERSIVALEKGGKEEALKVGGQFLTSWIPFGKYRISAASASLPGRRVAPSPEITIEIQPQD